MSEVETHLNSHIEYLEKQYAKGVFLASGRKVPRTGGVIFARTESRNTHPKLNPDPSAHLIISGSHQKFQYDQDSRSQKGSGNH